LVQHVAADDPLLAREKGLDQGGITTAVDYNLGPLVPKLRLGNAHPRSSASFPAAATLNLDRRASQSRTTEEAELPEAGVPKLERGNEENQEKASVPSPFAHLG
jgi:hypothetical protein